MLTLELILMLPSELTQIVHHSDANIGANPIPTSEFIPMLTLELIPIVHSNSHSDDNIGSNPIPTSGVHSDADIGVHSDADIGVHSDADIGVHSDADIGVDSDCPSFRCQHWVQSY